MARSGAHFAILLFLTIVWGAPAASQDVDKAIKNLLSRYAGQLEHRDMEQRIFAPFDWGFDFDGTDAILSGLAEGPGARASHSPDLFVQFFCSKRSVGVEISTKEFKGAPGVTNASVYLNKIHLLDTTAIDGSSFDAHTIWEKPDNEFISRISDFTRKLFHEPTIELKIDSPRWVGVFHMQRGDVGAFEHREAIANFREKCSTWWSAF